MMKAMNMTFGADPELWVTKNGVIVSAIGLVGGTKHEPIPVLNGALQEDNVLAEFNIDPCHNEDDFVNCINSVINQLHSRLGVGYSTEVKPSHNFDAEYLMSCPQAMEFGCNPDYNAWTASENPKPNAATTLRTAGGHIHIGYESPNTSFSLDIIKMCDILLGLPSLIVDSDTTRRTLYGKAGACRVKSYGVEYRTLSNFWLKTDSLKRWAFSAAKQAASRTEELPSILSKYSPELIQNTINSSDVGSALQIIQELNIEVPRL